MKKFLYIIITIFFAYITAFYTTGKENGFTDPFDFKFDFNKFINSLNVSSDLYAYPEGYNDVQIAEYRIKIAKEQIAKDNYQEAIGLLVDALHYDDKNRELYSLISACYLHQYDYDYAIEYYDKAFAADSLNEEALLGKGEVLLIQERTEDARNIFFQLYQLNPKNYKGTKHLAECYSTMGDNERAKGLSYELLKIDSTDVSIYEKIGSYCHKEGKYPEAVEAFNKYIKFAGDTNKYVFLNRGVNYYYMGEYDKSIEDYQKALTIDTAYTLAYDNMGFSLMEKKEYDKAIESFKHTIWSGDPENGYLHLGILYYNTKTYLQAIEILTTLNIDFPSNESSYFYLGSSYDNLGQNSEALAAYLYYVELAGTENADKQVIQRIQELQETVNK